VSYTEERGTRQEGRVGRREGWRDEGKKEGRKEAMKAHCSFLCLELGLALSTGTCGGGAGEDITSTKDSFSPLGQNFLLLQS
jgi:hypothetical protein